MGAFQQKFGSSVTGTLTGLDRLVLRGSLRQLARVEGLSTYLTMNKVLLKDFGKHAEKLSNDLKAANRALTQAQGRPTIYVSSRTVGKEERALEIARADGVTEGLVCALTSVEPCMTFDVHRNRDRKILELVARQRKCLFIYMYCIHPLFGWLNARIQTWLPFTIQVCLNGREWLSRQMDAAGIAYERSDNCFPWIGDVPAAQQLLDDQFKTPWALELDRIARWLNPTHDRVFRIFEQDYYWTVHQSEVATDVMFRDAACLDSIYPTLVQHAITTYDSPNVLRFLGHDRRTRRDGEIRADFSGEVTSSYRRRPEGVRVKHGVNGNSVKAYDKAGSVLRVETTMNNPRDFKVYRPRESDPNGGLAWQRMRKGIADLHRRAEVSAASNERYLEALAATDITTPLHELVAPVTVRVRLGNGGVRALRPWAEDDSQLLAAISRGEFAINGFRNRDVRRSLMPAVDTKVESKRQAAAVSRRLRILRGHRLIKKVPRTHRYVVTNTGRRIIAALLTARNLRLTPLDEAA
jgi:hypothetical protein